MICRILSLVILTGLLLSGCGKEEKKPVVTTPLLRIGVLSDLHINADTRYSVYDRLEKALMFYKEKGVDGIVIAGDLQDKYDLPSAISAMEEFEEIWQRVFPNNINDLTGEYVTPLFVYGNHDEAMVHDSYWFENMGSEYEDVWIQEVKGYQFVGIHYTKENDPQVQKKLEQAKEASPDKPFFFIQHVPMADSIIGGTTSYDGNSIPKQDSILRSYNCVVFTGHTHIPITDERTIWQSTSKKQAQYTVVSCGTLHYSFLGDYSDLTVNGDEHQTQQGMYMVVDGSQITLERYSFTDMEIDYVNGNAQINMDDAKLIGAPWTFDAMDKKDRPYDYNKREQKAVAPAFPAGTTLEVSELTATSATITVPAASVESPEGFSDVVQSYYAKITDTATGEVVAIVEVAAPYHIDTEPESINQPVTIYLTELTPNTAYTISVYARECYQKASEPLLLEMQTMIGE